jgi:hypothetical protein
MVMMSNFIDCYDYDDWLLGFVKSGKRGMFRLFLYKPLTVDKSMNMEKGRQWIFLYIEE